jgi:hypothetical protein
MLRCSRMTTMPPSRSTARSEDPAISSAIDRTSRPAVRRLAIEAFWCARQPEDGSRCTAVCRVQGIVVERLRDEGEYGPKTPGSALWTCNRGSRNRHGYGLARSFTASGHCVLRNLRAPAGAGKFGALPPAAQMTQAVRPPAGTRATSLAFACRGLFAAWSISWMNVPPPVHRHATGRLSQLRERASCSDFP